MRSSSEIAAACPIFGSDPEPSPRVMSLPMCSVTWAALCCSDCASVFTAMNSTPSTPASTMRLTAFTPPPPTPTTRSTGWCTATREICGSSRGRYSRAGSAGRSITLWGMSCEKAALSRSFGLGSCGSGSSAA